MVLSNSEKQKRFRLKRDAEFERLRSRMLLKIFSIYDTAVSTWGTPIFARSTGEILRSFVEAVNDPQSKLAKHPSDYTLFEIGTWDDDKCKFDLLLTPVALGKAIEYVKLTAPVLVDSK